MYDHDPGDVELLGWPEFIARLWESVFTGYRAGSGLRRTGRRWSDLIQAGLCCPQELADELVRTQIMYREDRNLELAVTAGALLAGMYEVVADLRGGLQELAAMGTQLPGSVFDQHALLLRQARLFAFGEAG